MKGLLATRMGWAVLAPMLHPGGVTVLMYHSIHAGATVFDGMHVDRFRQQMEWLHQRCTVVDPDHFEEALGLRAGLKPRVMLTFDDGYRDFHDVAYPILHRMRLPSLVFLTTGSADDGATIWTENVRWAIRSTEHTSACLPWAASPLRYALDSESSRASFERLCKHHLKGIPDDQSRYWQSELVRELGVDPRDLAVQRRMLNWNEVRATMELTRYGGHSHSHPILSQIARDAAADEVRLCRDRIAAETNVAPIHFAYPNGRHQDFNEVTKSLLREYGFRFGYSTNGGVHLRHLDPLAIRRQPTGAARLGDFAWLVAGRMEHP